MEFCQIYTIKTAVKNLIENSSEPTNCRIFSDSQNISQFPKSNACNFTLVVEIQLLIYHTSVKEIHANLCWVPWHLDVAGNKNAATGIGRRVSQQEQSCT